MKRLIALAAALLLAASSAHAELRAPFQVRYETQDGWSRWVKTDVTFVTGQELNTATSSLSYQAFTTYAVIFFSQNQAAVIRNTGFSLCSGDFDTSCLPTIGNFKGLDKGGRSWEICTGSIC